MDSSNSCPLSNSVTGNDSDSFPITRTSSPAKNCPPTHQGIASRQEKSEEKPQDSKQTTQTLCKSFIQKYKNSPDFFEPGTLALEFNVQIRRIYDLLNIFEGGGIIEKVQKSTYKWNDSYSISKQPYINKNEWCSLRNISSELKRFFYRAENGLTFHDLYQGITNGKSNKFNPSTIRRRIYECCKVFVIVGLIGKKGKIFYNGKLANSDVEYQMENKKLVKFQTQVDQENNQKILQLSKKQHKLHKLKTDISNSQVQDLEGIGLVQRQTKPIIKNFIDQIKTQQELYKFIEELKIQFKAKNLLLSSKHSAEVKMEEENSAKIIQRISWDDNSIIQQRSQFQSTFLTPQNHRKNIIISSSHQADAQFSFGPKSSFCSYPSNSFFRRSSKFNPPIDIKSK